MVALRIIGSTGGPFCNSQMDVFLFCGDRLCIIVPYPLVRIIRVLRMGCFCHSHIGDLAGPDVRFCCLIGYRKGVCISRFQFCDKEVALCQFILNRNSFKCHISVVCHCDRIGNLVAQLHLRKRKRSHAVYRYSILHNMQGRGNLLYRIVHFTRSNRNFRIIRILSCTGRSSNIMDITCTDIFLCYRVGYDSCLSPLARLQCTHLEGSIFRDLSCCRITECYVSSQYICDADIRNRQVAVINYCKLVADLFSQCVCLTVFRFANGFLQYRQVRFFFFCLIFNGSFVCHSRCIRIHRIFCCHSCLIFHGSTDHICFCDDVGGSQRPAAARLQCAHIPCMFAYKAGQCIGYHHISKINVSFIGHSQLVCDTFTHTVTFLISRKGCGLFCKRDLRFSWLCHCIRLIADFQYMIRIIRVCRFGRGHIVDRTGLDI